MRPPERRPPARDEPVRPRPHVLTVVALTCAASLALGAARAGATATPTPVDDLGARMSTAPAAMEYWDVSAWFASGHRLLARVLVTNQGPGSGTAAAVGHLLLPDGAVVPFKWGRTRDAWTLDAGGHRLAIAKVVLDVGGPTVVLEIASRKHAIDLHLTIDRTGPTVALRPRPDYAVDVAMPAPARARLQVAGTETARAITGTGAVTHTWMDEPESTLLRRRIELFAHEGDTALYLADVTRADGSRRGTVVASRDGRMLVRNDDPAVTFDRAPADGSGDRYPLATRWDVRSPALTARVDVVRELLRWNPLEILPQPFRFLVALGGEPQRIWADATVGLDVTPTDDGGAVHAALRGIVAATYARPLASTP